MPFTPILSFPALSKCDSKHLIAEAATLFDFWIASETELSAQSHLLVDAQALTRLRTGF